MKAGLYRSGFTPPRTPKGLDRTSMITSGPGQAGDVMRRRGVPPTFGDPAEAVGWFHPGTGTMVQMVADYANGHRVLLRSMARRWRVTISARPTEAAK